MKNAIVTLATLLLGLAVGAFVAAPPAQDAPEQASAATAAGPTAEPAAAPQLWTCSMHPNIKLPEKGLCPICNMDLIPLEAGSGDGPPQVAMSEAAKALARIATTEVKRKSAHVLLRMVGKVTYDETRVARLTAWFGGRIERLFVDFTGTVVKKGDHMLALYSPELLVAQQELIQAARDRARAIGPLKAAAASTYRAARDKLRLWGLQDWQIRKVLGRGRPLETVTIYAPMGGIVTHKAAHQGAWVKTGTPIYTIADLSHVWVELDAYESDIAWLRYGQRVQVEVDAFAGQPFAGTIAFVNPVMNERTRTIKVRVHIENPDLRLKPGMFVRAVADVPIAGSATAGAHDLAGKFVCPMHPEVVAADAKAKCRICGMPLVASEKHWLVGPALKENKLEAPLVIPHTAPLITGKRVVVFVEKEDADKPTYLVREIQLGPRAGDEYVVTDGLKEGERVVTRGAFRLDSAMQIVGDPSVMAHDPAEAKGDDANAPGESGSQRDGAANPLAALTKPELAALGKAANLLIATSEALANDDNAAAAKAAAHLHHIVAPLAKALGGYNDGKSAKQLLEASATVADPKATIDVRRKAFVIVNTLLIPGIASNAEALGVTHDHVFCPMANDNKGAGWLQKPGEVANPYYGESMLRCGGKKSGFEAVAKPAVKPAAKPAAKKAPATKKTPAAKKAPATKPGAKPAPEPAEPPELTALRKVTRILMATSGALARDDNAAAGRAAAGLPGALKPVTASLGASGTRLINAARAVAKPGATIKARRKGYVTVNALLIPRIKRDAKALGLTWDHDYCPMANDDKGAGWLQKPGPLANPYFGDMMLRCGSKKGSHRAGGK